MSNDHLVNAGNARPPSPPSRDDAELLRFVSQEIHSSARASLPSLAPTSLVPFSSPYASLIAAAMKPSAFTPAHLAASQMVTNNHLVTNSQAALAAQMAAKAGVAAREDDEYVDDGDNGKLHLSTSPPKKRRHYTNRPIDHTYTDYSMISDAELREMDQDSSVLVSPSLSVEKKTLMLKMKEMPCKNAGGATQSFPSKLHQVLDNTELVDIITWLPHGRCFVVLEPERLVNEVLPRYFNQTKILSFVRQLNLWGFKRLTRGVNGKAYYHELFLRGRSYLALRLKRQSVKGNEYKPIPNPSGEPNFFSHPPVDSLARMSVPSNEGTGRPPIKGNVPRSKKRIMIDRAEAGANKELLGNVVPTCTPEVAVKPHNQDSSFLTGTHRPTLDVERVLAPQPEAAAPSAYRLASLLTAGELKYAALSGMYASRPVANVGERFLAERLVQLQREEKQLEMLRIMNSNNMMAAPCPWQAGAHSVPGATQTESAVTLTSLLAGCANSMQISVSESLREAQHIEELALAARERARKAVIESQSRYGLGN